MNDRRARRTLCLLPLGLLLLLAGCAVRATSVDETEGTAPRPSATVPWDAPLPSPTPAIPQVDLALGEQDVTLAPLPVRAGIPFTITAVIHNRAAIPAIDVPFMIHISALRQQFGYQSFVRVLTTTVPASASLPVNMPVVWNLAGGEYQLWMQVNRLPDAWQKGAATLPEVEAGDNIVLLNLMVDPFDAYSSDLCAGRIDVEIGPTDVLPEPERQGVLVRVHNLGNRAVYNLPVVILGNELTGIGYTPAIPPCGGTVELFVEVDRPLLPGDPLTVQVNPPEWAESLEEDSLDNNSASVNAGLALDVDIPSVSGLQDYDFSISQADIEVSEIWIVLVTVHNLGTRDAAMVPIRIENAAGRKVDDAVPLVQGNGLGVAAIRVGYLWTQGGTLTFTVNPQDVKGAFPETNRGNNVATFTVP